MENIHGFSFTEYLAVFVSIVCGYIASEFFSGWGKLIKHRGKLVIKWDYILFTIIIYVLFIDFWWSTWPWYLKITESIYDFLLFLTLPLIFYMYSVYLFPAPEDFEGFDSDHFLIQKRFVYFLFIPHMLLASISSYILTDQGFLIVQNLFRFAGMAVAMSLYFTRKKRILFRTLLILAASLVVLNMYVNR